MDAETVVRGRWKTVMEKKTEREKRKQKTKGHEDVPLKYRGPDP